MSNVGDSVLINYKGKLLSGYITRINLQVASTIIYNIRCGNNEYEVWKNKDNGKIDVHKL